MEAIIVEAYHAWWWESATRLLLVELLMLASVVVYYFAKTEDVKDYAFFSIIALGVLGVGLGAQMFYLSHWPKVQAIRYLIGHE